jgi:hypothetical protein
MTAVIRVIDSLQWKYLMIFVALAWLILGLAVAKSLMADEPARTNSANSSVNLDSNVQSEISTLVQHARQ